MGFSAWNQCNCDRTQSICNMYSAPCQSGFVTEQQLKRKANASFWLSGGLTTGTPCSRSPGMAAGCWEAAKRALLVTARAVLQPSHPLCPKHVISTLHFLLSEPFFNLEVPNSTTEHSAGQFSCTATDTRLLRWHHGLTAGQELGPKIPLGWAGESQRPCWGISCLPKWTRSSPATQLQPLQVLLA